MSNHCVIDTSSDVKLELSVASHICEVIDTPRALAVWLLIKYGEFDQLVELTIDPSLYEDISAFADDYLVTEVLRKSPNLPCTFDRRGRALQSFYDSEAQCKEINDRLCDFSAHEPDVVHRARKWILRTLGSDPDLSRIETFFRFGPGATTGVRGSGSALSDKYDAEMHLTLNLYPYYKAILGSTWWEHQRTPRIVEGNKFTTVPKSAKTDRGICAEPTLNSYVQLGIGQMIRSKLARRGVDLNSQQKNQRLASEAYDRSLATIDLSAASDSIAWSTVLSLLPPNWFELLDLCRSTHSLVDGQVIELEKFSSMGNGYTFELESLIFASLAFSIVPRDQWDDVSIYGDDIIVPADYAVDLIEALNYFGFRVNESKSFLAGSFFESCGTDWFKGFDVRPFYLKKGTDKPAPYSVQIANSLRLYASRVYGGLGCDPRFHNLWKALHKSSPRQWRKCKVPPQFGDVGFIVSRDDVNYRSDFGGSGFKCLTMTISPRKVRKRTVGRLLVALALTYNPEILRVYEKQGVLHLNAARLTNLCTRGWEPRRGFLGEPRPKWTRSLGVWSDGLSWA